MDRFSIFIPIDFSKITELPDGSLQVYGRATQEIPDSAKEILDYESSVPHFIQRSQEMMKATGDQNAFPLREMHQPSVAGKVTQFDFKPDEKAIDVGLEVHDPTAITKVKKRDYTGLSVGGRYIHRWPDPSGKYVRYEGDPLEISLVDRPAVPTARINFFKSADADLYSDEKPMWVDELINTVKEAKEAADILNAFAKQAQDEKDKQETRLKAIGESVGIPRRNGEPLTPPKGYPTDLSDYADPANYAYPCDEPRASTAVGYFNGGNGADKYTLSQRHLLGRRIARLAGRFGTKYAYDPSTKTIERKDVNKMAKLDLATIDPDVLGVITKYMVLYDPDKLPLLNKLDVGGLMRQLKAYKQMAMDQASKDPSAAKDALSMLVSNLDNLDLSEPMDTKDPGSQVKDPSTAIKAAQADKPAPATTTTDSSPSSSPASTTTTATTTTPANKAAGAKEVGATTTTDSSPSSTDNTDAYQAAKKIEQLEASQAEMVKAVNTLAETLTKFMTGKTPADLQKSAGQHADSPIQALNGIIQPQKDAAQTALEDPIVKALLGDDPSQPDPYAWFKALKAAGYDDPMVGPQIAEQRVHQAMHKGSYATMEQGGILTKSNPRYQVKLYNPADNGMQ